MADLIPSVDKWRREEFLHARAIQTAACKAAWEKAGSPSNQIIVDVGDKIICDQCGADVGTDFVRIVDFGRRLACELCFEKHYAKAKVFFRIMRKDGTLGAYVSSHGKDEEYE